MLKDKGFSLIEVVVVAAILSILAAIAIPNYTKYVTNARRADGKTALTIAAQAMERYFTNNYTFLNATIGDDTNSEKYTVQETSDSGYYNLSFTTPESGSTNPSANTFRIQAVADPNGKQANDTLCQTMTINQRGEKKAYDNLDAVKTSDCWK